MQNNRTPIGTVQFLQVQRKPLKVGEPADRVYDPSGLERVAELRLTPEGVVGVGAGGEQILDAHHRDHPESRFRGANGISVGFSAHYDRIRARFGSHITDGIAGENILVTSGKAYSAEDLAGQLVFENPDGTRTVFRLNQAMAPCDEFSHYVHQADTRLPAAVLKDTLQFLDGGRRGFTLHLEEETAGRVLPGARVFILPG